MGRYARLYLHICAVIPCPRLMLSYFAASRLGLQRLNLASAEMLGCQRRPFAAVGSSNRLCNAAPRNGHWKMLPRPEWRNV
jgi:hypothetical protein